MTVLTCDHSIGYSATELRPADPATAIREGVAVGEPMAVLHCRRCDKEYGLCDVCGRREPETRIGRWAVCGTCVDRYRDEVQYEEECE